MASNYSYQKVHDVDIEGDSEVHNVKAAFEAPTNDEAFPSRLSEQTVWFKRSSVSFVMNPGCSSGICYTDNHIGLLAPTRFPSLQPGHGSNSDA